ncbi:hypothetical protein SO802_013637 [Lithocarpus litseifolius]|uniref:Retrotransposon gag domain-containing protein n=1 Tax=Lithocarpus litseifolius TaxID=425828 RepID=A0AAW2DA98_9ROSI
MEQFFEQANFTDNKKVRYAKLKLRGKAQRFWESLEYFRYMKYEPAIYVWEDMKEKLCDEIAQIKQKKTQTNSTGKPRILDHNELIAAPIEDNIDDDILVVENPLATPKPNIDIDIHASTSVALICVQGNEFNEEQYGEEMVAKESIMLEGAHDVILEANESAFDQPSMVHEDKQFAKVEKVDNILLPMVQDKIMLIPHIDFVISEEFVMVEFKVSLFSMLPKVILDLKQALLVSILILQCFRTQGRVFSNQRRMMQETQEDYCLVLFMFASQFYFYVLGPISSLGF